jgi:ubiquinone/menaquinone biosynthesis C-methylase UbiE
VAERSNLGALLNGLKAAGESTRLRLLALLDRSELTVKDLTAILAQSQPRISRHLKLLTEAGLVLRFPEGAWAYYARAEDGESGALCRAILSRLDEADPVLSRDRERLAAVKTAHATAASDYFARSAGDWDRIRSLHLPEAAVEAAILATIGSRPFGTLLDIGTGTGRMLELLASYYTRALGIDASHDMLSVARANLDRLGLTRAQVRHGDVYDLNAPSGAYDLVVIHQVLHYLDDPARALGEAARTLAPGGRLLVVDFAPHELEFLRTEHAHRRLGFSHEHLGYWLEHAGLTGIETRDLAPDPGSAAELTVTLWLASDPRPAEPKPARQPALEEA